MIDGTRSDVEVRETCELLMTHVASRSSDWSLDDYMRLLIDIHGCIESELDRLKSAKT